MDQAALAGPIAIEPVPGWKGQVVHGRQMTLISYVIAADAPDVHEHQHLEEEAWTVIEGGLAVSIDGQERTIGPGEVAVIGSNVRHRVRALQASRALVIDSPRRRHLPGSGH